MLSITERPDASKLLSVNKHSLNHAPGMEIGDLIRKKRNERDLSQVGLANLLGVNKSAVAQWELGTTTPTNENWAALRRALAITETVEVSPDAPYPGQVVDDPDELAWLRFWRSMNDERRTTVAELLHVGLPSRKRQ